MNSVLIKGTPLPSQLRLWMTACCFYTMTDGPRLTQGPQYIKEDDEGAEGRGFRRKLHLCG